MLKKVSSVIENAYRYIDVDNIKVQKKEQYDIVTNVDLDLESIIINELRSIYPTHVFSSEESGRNTPNDSDDIYEWVIDPIDGTINFANGLPFYTTSLCLKHNNDIILGIVYERANNNFYYAIKNQGAYLNGDRISVSKKTDIGNCIFTFMLTSHYTVKETEDILNIVRKLSVHVRGMRLLVSQALELCYIACGKMDGTICIKSKGFSSSAGTLILREAGGKVTDLDGNEYKGGSSSLLATNGIIHCDVINILK